MSLLKLVTALKGGSGSGNFGHAGRPGKRGGSSTSLARAGGLKLNPWVDWSNAKHVGDAYIVDAGGKMYAALVKQGKVVSTTQARVHGGKEDIPRRWTFSSSESLEHRKGYATELYLTTMRMFGDTPVSPEFQQTDAGKALWNSLRRNPAVKVNDDGSIVLR